MAALQLFLKAIPFSFLAMVTVINPLGAGFLLDAMTQGIQPQMRKTLARKIVMNCVGVFLVVLILGNYILSFFGLSLPIIRVAGGLLLTAMGWEMLNAADAPETSGQDVAKNPQTYLKRSFYPFTFPVTAGPGCIAVLFTLTAHRPVSADLSSVIGNLAGTFVGLFGVAILIYFCYVYSSVIEKRLGESGAHALNRIMAFITFCIGLEIVWSGIRGLLKTLT